MSIPSSIVDTRIKQIRPLIPPACLLEELPVPASLIPSIQQERQQAASIIHRQDDRLLVVIGPCSIHDPEAAIDYAHRLLPLAQQYASTLLVCMRVYFEKPRTTVGWKGLINDPLLDGSYAINTGLRTSRKLMLDINQVGLPIACEMLDTITPQFISDLVSAAAATLPHCTALHALTSTLCCTTVLVSHSMAFLRCAAVCVVEVTWGAIGARTTESQLHRELVSGLSFPIGFKNGTGGSKKIAVDAIVASQSPHCFLSVTTQGLAAIVETDGNSDCHIVLRGSETGTNYTDADMDETEQLMSKAKLQPSIMVDCSHGNSAKNHNNQPQVVAAVCQLLRNGRDSVIGVMIESNLHEGNQKLECGVGVKERLKYGVSVTDACIGWPATESVLKELSEAVEERRRKRGSTHTANGNGTS